MGEGLTWCLYLLLYANNTVFDTWEDRFKISSLKYENRGEFYIVPSWWNFGHDIILLIESMHLQIIFWTKFY